MVVIQYWITVKNTKLSERGIYKITIKLLNDQAYAEALPFVRNQLENR